MANAKYMIDKTVTGIAALAEYITFLEESLATRDGEISVVNVKNQALEAQVLCKNGEIFGLLGQVHVLTEQVNDPDLSEDHIHALRQEARRWQIKYMSEARKVKRLESISNNKQILRLKRIIETKERLHSIAISKLRKIISAQVDYLNLRERRAKSGGQLRLSNMCYHLATVLKIGLLEFDSEANTKAGHR